MDREKELYKDIYLTLFNAITDALEVMESQEPACEILKQAQRTCEEKYIECI